MNNFYQRMKFIEAQGVPRRNIIDGRIFQAPNLDFPRLISEGIAYGVFETTCISGSPATMDKKIYRIKNSSTVIQFGALTYVNGADIIGTGLITLGKFSTISWGISFRLSDNCDHDWRKLTVFPLYHFGIGRLSDFFSPTGICKIDIGNDVWVGRNSVLKSNNPARPLKIGDGAVIASDSVVVKNVPPYAIVGGNPAQIIKYRFSEDIIEALLRIKWWDWDIDKIYENFKYFNRVEEFVAIHDK